MGFLSIFAPPAHTEEISDKKVVDKTYRYWRWRIFYSMYTGYVFFYLTRRSFTFAMPALMADLNLDKTQLGLLGSTLYIVYGISKFASGILSDKSNPRYFMAVGLIITGIANILFGFSSSILLFTIFWGINGWFQGFGWPPCSRLLTHWYSKSERGSWWSAWSTSHNLGGMVIPILAAFIAQKYGWRYAMFVPGVLCIGAGFWLINRLRDTPQSLGLPSIEKHRNEFHGDHKKENEADKELTFKEIVFKFVLKNHYIWILGFASIFIYIIRTGMDWSALYLMETKGYSLVSGSYSPTAFEAGGFIGMLVAGWFSDRISGGRRGPMNVIFSVGMLVSIILFWYYPGVSMFMDLALAFCIGFFVFGPQMLIGLAAAELAHKNAAGTSTGFVGWFSYFGAAFAFGILGYVIQKWGWDAFFIAMSLCGVLSVLLFLPLWSADSNKVHSKFS